MSDTPAVVLAGGGSTRLGGADKTRLLLDGVPLLDRVLAALTGPVVVVGPTRPTCRAVAFMREEPAGGGPLAALAAGLAGVRGPRVLLLAADLPFLTPAALRVLEEAAGRGSAMAVDDAGRDQPLLSCWDAGLLRDALPPVVAGGRLRAATGAVDAVRVELPGHPPPWWDCDTPEAWAQALAWTGGP
ncbi:MAG: molybdopterin-guanine dinucleotide biosynthesis protein [Blastococcus sp.]|nr:molybdopterin-guanine dinucleotide biosynthesis protein [Blastococcus sp.]